MRRQLTAKYEAVEIHYRLFIVPKSEIPYTRRASKTLWARSFELLVPFDSSFQFGFCAIVQRFCLFHRIAKTFYGFQFFFVIHRFAFRDPWFPIGNLSVPFIPIQSSSVLLTS